jgi:SAM-dependent methyltransferase
MWTPTSQDNALMYCEIDYYRSTFFQYFPQTGRILEGGCRLGQYVIYCQNHGYDIYGLDAVIKPLCWAKEHQPRAMLSAGDVRPLPFKSKTFRAYFSNGVAEHFEEGPFGVVQEAHRVLENGGLLIITVPYINVKRRVEDFLFLTLNRKSSRRLMRPDGVEMIYKRQRSPGKSQTLLEGYHFHTYYFTRREFARILENSGFRVIKNHGISVEWGLMEFYWLRTLYRLRRLYQRPGEESSNGQRGNGSSAFLRLFFRTGIHRRLKKLIVSEVPKSFLARPLLGLFRVLFGHLVLFVCKKV